jgi:hypothetical protein
LQPILDSLLQTIIMKALKSHFHRVSKTGQARDPEKGSSESALPDALTNRRRSAGSAHAQSSISSRSVSHRSGLFPDGDFRNSAMPQIIEIRCEVMVNWLYAQQAENLWCQGDFGEGVVLKKTRDSYTTCPKELMDERNGIYDAVRRLNVRVGFEPYQLYPPNMISVQ